jgi:MoaA/NifB/PqqE/SkfB family radical SAM enzyme
MPITANYYVTLRCNQRCIFCNIPHTNDGSPSREPKIEQVRANLRDLKRLGVIVLDITGGEPLLYRNLIEMLDYAAKLRFFTTVTTNGMLYPKFADQLVGRVKALLFSIDSTDPEEHDRIRAMKSFHQVVEALAVARKLKQTLYISHVVTNESYGKVDEMIRFAKDQGAILYLNPCFSFFGNEGLDADKAAGLERYFGRPGVILDPAQLALIADGGNKREDPVCRAVSSSVVISPENELWLPCYHFRQQGIPIEDNLYEVWTKNATVQEAKRMEGRHDFCEGCTVYCYMRSSLQWKYPVKSVKMAGIYFRERIRQRVMNWVDPPNPAPIPESAPRRRLPLAEPGVAAEPGE